MARQFIYLTGNTQWTVPNDFNSSNNIVHVIGAGYAGTWNGDGSGQGGGGGGYARKANLLLTRGSVVNYYVDVPNGSNTTWFDSISTVAANSAVGRTPGTGVAGDVKYTGGAGSGTVGYAACGGGAAGPNGNGNPGGASSAGSGDAGFGGGAGADGNEFGNGYGSGGGAFVTPGSNAGRAGNYGAGGAMRGAALTGESSGAQGLIVIEYEPGDPTPTQNLSIKYNGEWVKPSDIFVKNNGTWTKVQAVYVKNNGNWIKQ